MLSKRTRRLLERVLAWLAALAVVAVAAAAVEGPESVLAALRTVVAGGLG